MKWLSLILISLVLTGASFAQDNKTKKETKEETAQRKKEERKAETDKQFRQTDTLLTGKRFVLEAQFLKNTRGMRIPVTSDLNFIAIDSLSGIIQIGSPQRVGYNGVGGITEEGRILSWKIVKNDKKKNFYITMTIQCKFGVYDIGMNVNCDGYAYANLTGMRYGSLGFEGNLVPREGSTVYKGQSR